MSEVLETVPLRPGLGVNVYFIIHCFEGREVRKIDFLLVESFTIEARELHVV